ncbi:YfcZ/YiiS family protein [Glaesserella parasuis]|uniref:YfcZ/YiiS family protein n=1 Tax=Glaesserella parasuis TaxID=738 RepID=UPI00271ECDFA|nr:YfcZ/YiiS family protein [Glaesserella parasuis]
MSKTFSDQANCCGGICKPSSTSMFDNADSTIELALVYPTQADAEQGLTTLTAKAREVESDPCNISSQISQTEDGFLLQAKFLFSCQAEAVIFQMKLR